MPKRKKQDKETNKGKPREDGEAKTQRRVPERGGQTPSKVHLLLQRFDGGKATCGEGSKPRKGKRNQFHDLWIGVERRGEKSQKGRSMKTGPGNTLWFTNIEGGRVPERAWRDKLRVRRDTFSKRKEKVC